MERETSTKLFLVVFWLKICSIASLTTSSLDEFSLVSLKTSLNSELLSKNWSQETSFCTWIGVICSQGSPRVISLNISNMGLRGTIAREIGNLSFLTVLDMSNNNISGMIPREVGNLRRLRVLDLSNNKLSDHVPESLGLLRDIETLNLSSNQLSGAIPTSLSVCGKLKKLDISGNSLTGNIPIEFGNLSQLQDLVLWNNKLTAEYGSNGLISTMVDVYSYGILLMEVFSRRKPTDEMFSGELTMRRWVSESFPSSVVQIIDGDLLTNMKDESTRSRHVGCLTSIIGVALNCTADLPEERPNMKDVATTINTIMSNLSEKI